MGSDQMRFNTGKAKLSYLDSAHRAIDELHEVLAVAPELAVEPVTFMYHLRAYLAGGSRRDLFVGLAGFLVFGERELGGEPIDNNGLYGIGSFPLMTVEFLKVCEFGESKYARGNYRLGAPTSNYFDSLLRHHRAWFRGEEFDSDAAALGFETRHIGHMFWNWVMAADQPDVRDDRLPPVQFGEFDPGMKTPVESTMWPITFDDGSVCSEENYATCDRAVEVDLFVEPADEFTVVDEDDEAKYQTDVRGNYVKAPYVSVNVDFGVCPDLGASMDGGNGWNVHFVRADDKSCRRDADAGCLFSKAVVFDPERDVLV